MWDKENFKLAHIVIKKFGFQPLMWVKKHLSEACLRCILFAPVATPPFFF
jgi:hypothetical protein